MTRTVSLVSGLVHAVHRARPYYDRRGWYRTLCYDNAGCYPGSVLDDPPRPVTCMNCILREGDLRGR